MDLETHDIGFVGNVCAGRWCAQRIRRLERFLLLWSVSHLNLQKACVYLFPEPRDARLLVSESGMDASRVNFEEPPELRWQSIILEAEKQNTLYLLVPVLLAKYPQNEQLKSACAPFELAEPIKADVRKENKPIPKPVAQVLVEPEMVPMEVPRDIADDELGDPAATIVSLRMIASSQEKRISQLEKWRRELSKMSSEQAASKTGEEEDEDTS